MVEQIKVSICLHFEIVCTAASAILKMRVIKNNLFVINIIQIGVVVWKNKKKIALKCARIQVSVLFYMSGKRDFPKHLTWNIK